MLLSTIICVPNFVASNYQKVITDIFFFVLYWFALFLKFASLPSENPGYAPDLIHLSDTDLRNTEMNKEENMLNTVKFSFLIKSTCEKRSWLMFSETFYIKMGSFLN